MASGVEKKFIKYLDCPICLERLKEPKMLLCQHSYCRECLEKLVAAEGEYRARCPECREKIKVPPGGVQSLQSNFLINSLLSELHGQCAAVPSCEKHAQEIILFCETCDQLICRYCIISDHRDHQSKSTKDMYPAGKETVSKIVEELKGKILALETSLEVLDTYDRDIRINYKEVCSKVDTFIDEQVKVLRKKQDGLKDELQELARVQNEHHETQRRYFLSSLDNMKRSVTFAEHALKGENEVEVLVAKKELTQLSSVTCELQPEGMISYDLEIKAPLEKGTVENLAKIKECDNEYRVEMRDNWSEGQHFQSFIYEEERRFHIRRKINSTSFDPLPVNEIQVKIQRMYSNHVNSAFIVKEEDGSFTFSYSPLRDGDYEIEVVIKGRCLQGSPLKWEVLL